MIDNDLCREMVKHFYYCIILGAGHLAKEKYFSPLAAELGRDIDGALEFLGNMPMEQFESLMPYAVELIDACTSNKRKFAYGMYVLAKARGADALTMHEVSVGRIHAGI